MASPGDDEDGQHPWWGWVRRGLTAVVLCVAGVAGFLALTAPFAPRASAAPPPVVAAIPTPVAPPAPSPARPMAPNSRPASSPTPAAAALSLVGAALDTTTPVLPAPVARAANTVTTGVSPLAGSTVGSVTHVVTSVGTHIASPAPSTDDVWAAWSSLLTPPSTTATHGSRTSGAHRAATTSGLVPAPRRAPSHLPRSPDPMPSTPMGIASESSVPGHGSGPPGALLPTTLLLPVLVMAGIVLARGRQHPLLSFPRFVPPG